MSEQTFLYFCQTICKLAEVQQLSDLVGKPVEVKNLGPCPIVASTIAIVQLDIVHGIGSEAISFLIPHHYVLTINPSAIEDRGGAWKLSGSFLLKHHLRGPQKGHSVYINNKLIFNELGLIQLQL